MRKILIAISAALLTCSCKEPHGYVEPWSELREGNIIDVGLRVDDGLIGAPCFTPILLDDGHLVQATGLDLTCGPRAKAYVGSKVVVEVGESEITGAYARIVSRPRAQR